jgi:hypothetical protein
VTQTPTAGVLGDTKSAQTTTLTLDVKGTTALNHPDPLPAAKGYRDRIVFYLAEITPVMAGLTITTPAAMDFLRVAPIHRLIIAEPTQSGGAGTIDIASAAVSIELATWVNPSYP